MSKYDELVRKLKEILQIDKPELDFGIYRILNARAAEINDYLENRLKIKIHDLLLSAGTANFDQIQKELQEAEKNASNLGVNPDSVPKVQELRRKIEDVNVSSSGYENAVFSHLLNFFSRYYDSGDFISKRRYKGNTYSIPYAGEEVLLHWANKDQYYIKSGENFSNYAFRLNDGRRVCFRLIFADIDKNNCKNNDYERRFVLIEPQTLFKTDIDGDEYEETIVPIEEVNGELTVRFEYRIMPKGNQQEDMVSKTAATILANPYVNANWNVLGEKESTEKNLTRTLLEKHLSHFTAKNTMDYFIHKNLEKFLLNELDFYIKNEILQIDDIQTAERFADIERNLRMIQCLRSIAFDLITFLAQLENFQKKLWLKKKIVVTAHYCVTLDYVDQVAPELLQLIADSDSQWMQWRTLGMIDNKTDLAKIKTIDYLQTHPFLMVDTALFNNTFKASLLKNIENLDDSIDGILIHSDNFQALNFAKERFREGVDFIYIDPPYNTAHSKIIYKNQFEHSSWLALIANTLPLTNSFFKSNYSFGFAIDDYEYNNAFICLRDHFTDCDVSTIVINHHPQGSGGRLSRTHEYYIVASPQNGMQYLGREKEDADEERSFMRSGTAENNYRSGRWRSFYALLMDPKTKKIVGTEPPPPIGQPYPIDETKTGLKRIYPINASNEERVWRSSYETGKNRVENGEIFITERYSVKQLISHKSKRETVFSNWIGADYNSGTNGTAVLNDLGLGGFFDYPKSVKTLEQAFWMQSFGKKQFTVLDYFAGSGTTGHAVISLNREDKQKRKYILVEQGEYFDTVLKPRIQKVVFSSTWKNGKPIPSHKKNNIEEYDGISHIFKVIKLESYEDTLNNLELSRDAAQTNLLNTISDKAKEDYLLRYLLNIESRGSLLSVKNFNNPFNCKLKIAIDSAGAYEELNIDLIETFNYLIGLRVKNIDMQQDNGFAKVTGWLTTGENVLILWRNTDLIDYQKLNEICEKFFISTKDNEFDVIYINGDHNIPSVLKATNEEGEVTRALKLQQIEPEFLNRMFSVEVK